MNNTERIIYDLCNDSFFYLWSYPNPIGKKGKELCDILVVCEPDIIIFSVKEISIEKNDTVTFERWKKRAIDKSVRQIYGAERYIKVNEILTDINKEEIKIDKSITWNIHRVAIIFGRGNKYPLIYGNFGKGFVSVFYEISFGLIMKE